MLSRSYPKPSSSVLCNSNAARQHPLRSPPPPDRIVEAHWPERPSIKRLVGELRFVSRLSADVYEEICRGGIDHAARATGANRPAAMRGAQSASFHPRCLAWCHCSGEDQRLSICKQWLGQLITMPPLSVRPKSKSDCCPVWLACLLLGLAAAQAHAKDVLTVPQQVSVSANKYTRQLSISWLGGAATTFDLMILRTELNETVFYETVSVTVNQVTGWHQRNWTSVEPLECTSLSIKIRSRDGETTSEWSDTQILQGNDLPSNEKFQMYPLDRVIHVGSNTTFCCIVEEGKLFGTIRYNGTAMNTTRVSRRSYAITVVNQGPSSSSGTNVVCYNSLEALSGAVVFVGYTPLPSDFVCETHDLISAVCQWNEARDTHLYGKRGTRYSLNKRDCGQTRRQQKPKVCRVEQWEGNWTLVAVNPLGQYSLTDSAELSHRVRPVAPADLNSAINAWNATVLWQWTYSSYSSLALVCQVELDCHGSKTNLTVSGVGLQSVVLSDLHPDEDYSVKIRCGAQQNFWKWGNWSEPFAFKTNTYVPDAPDVWMWMNRDNTGQVIWKPLTRRLSHGQITGYEVTLWSFDENVQHTQFFPPDATAAPVNLTQMATFSGDTKVIATVIAKNNDGSSQPASVTIHLRLTDAEPCAVSRAVYTESGFSLLWPSDPNATCGYVVEWHEAICSRNCPVDWIKVAAGNTNVSVESDNFQLGVRYNFSLYSCSTERLELLQCWQGYVQELVPSSSVLLSTSQQASDILLTWGEIPLVNRRGFLLGYNIYNSTGSELKLLANLPDKENRSYTVKGLSEGSHKFTVKAYTSAGEDAGATASISLEPYTDWLILEILTSLGITALFLVIVTFICYKKRKWVKTAFYPDIPEPKLPGDWSRTQGPLDVKPSSHSILHIVEKPDWDSSKEALVVIPEEDEDEEGMGDEPVDTDEPTSLRYYNQVVDERPIRPRFPDSSDSSASSLDSARTDVTYTGIQTSGSSLVFQLDPQGHSEGHQPHTGLSFGGGGGGGGGYRPQMQARGPSDDISLVSPEPFAEPQAASAGGYKPQSSWQLDSPVEAEECGGRAPSLGSPTSVASTQFLLPDGEEQAEEKRQQSSSSAATWFNNLLSSTKP
ncbi:putative leukemia inhibitory factor receptor-like [Scophthalmus maximus]|uniref:Putative leukemia inhibitory factor receptor-like n=1 Tax=Scophthalmus maximus TaxID=52904 RepID=A0A2U9BT72_SCOMX|nr:putative leukemia inhibitory factor receptor-like [Scophthalmus maximus]